MGEIEYETPIEIKDLFKAFRNILIMSRIIHDFNSFNLCCKVPYVRILDIRVF